MPELDRWRPCSRCDEGIPAGNPCYTNVAGYAIICPGCAREIRDAHRSLDSFE